MTEEEAKTKICCGLPNVAMSIIASSPKSNITVLEHFCIGSACMAWRWGKQVYQNEKLETFDPDTGVRTDYHGVLVQRGHCGLAGKP